MTLLFSSSAYASQAQEIKEFNTEATRQIGIAMVKFHKAAIDEQIVDIRDHQAVRKFLRPKKGKKYRVPRSGMCPLGRLVTISSKLAEDTDDYSSLQADLTEIYNSYHAGEISPDDFKLNLTDYGLKNTKQLNRSLAQLPPRIEKYQKIKNSVDELIQAKLPLALTAEKAWVYFHSHLPDYFGGMIAGELKPKFIAYVKDNYGID